MKKTPPLEILYEDNHLLVVNKPPGLATMGLPAGEETLLTRSKDYLAKKYAKPGNVYLGVVSRLDTPVAGVVVFARTSKAAERLNAQFRCHSVEKTYLAVVEGIIPPEGTCRDRIYEYTHGRKAYIPREAESRGWEKRGAGQPSNVYFSPEATNRPEGGKDAVLHYRRLQRIGETSLVEVRLETGRKHQIRLQLSHLGHPILGDRKYGSNKRFPDGIALCAVRLALTHPTTGLRLEFSVPIPDAWRRFGISELDI